MVSTKSYLSGAPFGSLSREATPCAGHRASYLIRVMWPLSRTITGWNPCAESCIDLLGARIFHLGKEKKGFSLGSNSGVRLVVNSGHIPRMSLPGLP